MSCGMSVLPENRGSPRRCPCYLRCMRPHLSLLLLGSLSLSFGCSSRAPAPAAPDVKTFLDTVNGTMRRLGIEQNRAGWVQQTFITDDTDALSARANREYSEAIARFAKDATRYDKVAVPADTRRQLDLLKLALVMVTPSDPKEAEELTNITAKLESTYGKGKW